MPVFLPKLTWRHEFKIAKDIRVMRIQNLTIIDILYNYGPGVRDMTTQRRPKSNLRTLVALVGLRPPYGILQTVRK